jgi:hypothetical protein|nr:MAG TPA: hypothetical protein [Caudoviricetes sp.]
MYFGSLITYISMVYIDYAINHAHDVATINNNSNELWECSKEYLYFHMIDLITAHNDIVDYWEC